MVFVIPFAKRRSKLRKVRDPQSLRDLAGGLRGWEVEIIVNLTRPYEHFAVTKAALEAGKHVYTEKPLAATKEEGTAG